MLALRHLGAARTGAYFSVAPFVGVASALLFQHEPLTIQLLRQRCASAGASDGNTSASSRPKLRISRNGVTTFPEVIGHLAFATHVEPVRCTRIRRVSPAESAATVLGDRSWLVRLMRCCSRRRASLDRGPVRTLAAIVHDDNCAISPYARRCVWTATKAWSSSLLRSRIHTVPIGQTLTAQHAAADQKIKRSFDARQLPFDIRRHQPPARYACNRIRRIGILCDIALDFARYPLDIRIGWRIDHGSMHPASQ